MKPFIATTGRFRLIFTRETGCIRLDLDSAGLSMTLPPDDRLALAAELIASVKMERGVL